MRPEKSETDTLTAINLPSEEIVNTEDSLLIRKFREQKEEKEKYTKETLSRVNDDNSTYKKRLRENEARSPLISSSYQNDIFEEISPNKPQKDATPNPHPRESLCTRLSKTISRLFC